MPTETDAPVKEALDQDPALEEEGVSCPSWIPHPLPQIWIHIASLRAPPLLDRLHLLVPGLMQCLDSHCHVLVMVWRWLLYLERCLVAVLVMC